jgi:hypothetical protein
MINEYATLPVQGLILPDSIMKIVSDEVKDFSDDDKELTRLVNECYPLISTLAYIDHRISKKEANELVTYINAKV